MSSISSQIHSQLLKILLLTSFVCTGLTESPAAQGSEEREENTWSVGIGVIASPRPYEGVGAEVFPVPVVTGRYKRFFFQGIRGGVELLPQGPWSARAFAQAQFRGLEPEESDFLSGMTTRRKSADAGVNLGYQGRPVGFQVEMITDVLGRSHGQEASFQVTSGLPLGPWGLLLAGVGPRWLSADRVDYYYGVRPDEALSNRPAYTGSSTWNWDLTLTALLSLSSNWNLTILFDREDFGSEITGSPLINQGAGYSLITSLTYRIK